MLNIVKGHLTQLRVPTAFIAACGNSLSNSCRLCRQHFISKKKSLEINVPAVPRPHGQRGGAVPALPGEVGTAAPPRTVTLITDPKQRLRVRLTSGTAAAPLPGGKRQRGWKEPGEDRREGKDGLELLELQGKT